MADWLILNTTNSAGFTGATPMSATTWPASRTSAGLVSSSHLTKKAYCALSPSSAPSRQTRVRKAPTSRRIERHSR